MTQAQAPAPEAEAEAERPEKTLAELLGESSRAMARWIEEIGAEQEPVGPGTRHEGPVKHLDELHCVQKTGRRYAVHRLTDLDAVPERDDPSTSIRYRDGRAQVFGKTTIGVQR